VIVDLFCGAGGASEGALAAATELGLEVEVYAINCWQTAIDTYKLNHPYATTLCARVEQVVPEQLIPNRRIHLLVAGPECTHHSQARGGMPIDDQKRVPAWVIPNWLQRMVVDNLIIENVPEFEDWAPLGAHGKPLKSKRGEIFNSYLESIRACRFKLDYRKLICADYGDFTTRKRLFILGTRKGAEIVWPEPTHISREKLKGQASLFVTTNRKPWRAAKEIIDWSLKGTNIFDRKRPLAEKTLKRIAGGMKKINRIDLEPFLVKLYGTGTTTPVDRPLPTVTANGNHLFLAQPFVLSQASGGAARNVEEPIPAVCTRGAEQLIEPFIVDQFNTHKAKPLEEPLGTVTTTSRGVRLIQPFLVTIDQQGAGDTSSPVDKPVSTVTTKVLHAQVDSFVVGCGGRRAQTPARSVEDPLNTVTTKNDAALIEPFVIAAGGPEGKGRKPRRVELPLTTLLTENHQALVDPFLVVVNDGDEGSPPSGGRCKSVEEPLPTSTGNNSLGVVEPNLVKVGGMNLIPIGEGLFLGIRFRMLQDYELAASHGFDRSFKFTRKKSDNVKLVGNSWPKQTATALCRQQLRVYVSNQVPGAILPPPGQQALNCETHSVGAVQ